MKIDGIVVTPTKEKLAFDAAVMRAWDWWSEQNPGRRYDQSRWNQFADWLLENYGVEDLDRPNLRGLWNVVNREKYTLFVLRWL